MATGKRTKAKSAAAKPSTQSAELKRLRGRLEYEVDDAVKRALRGEIARLEKTEKDANLAFKTEDGKALRPPEKVYRVETSGTYYSGGRRRVEGIELIVRELVSIRKGEREYGGGQAVVVTGRTPGTSGAQQLQTSAYGNHWWSSKALAIKEALTDVEKELKSSREELADQERKKAEIAALSNQPEATPAAAAAAPKKKPTRPEKGGTRYHKPATQKSATPWTLEADAELAERIAEGASADEIAGIMTGRSRESVRKRAGRLHLKFASTNGRAVPPVLAEDEEQPPPKTPEESIARIAAAAAEEAEPIEAGAVFANRTFPAQRVRVRERAGGEVLYVHLTQDGRPGDPGLDTEEDFRREYVAAEEPVEV